MIVNIARLEREAVAAALYNAARPAGMGFLQYQREPISVAEMREILIQERGTSDFDYLDYVRGRYLKLAFDSNTNLDVSRYDSVNGEGTAEKAIASLRLTGSTANDITQSLHREGKGEAIRDAERAIAEDRAPIVEETEFLGHTINTVTLHLQDTKGELKEAINRSRDDDDAA